MITFLLLLPLSLAANFSDSFTRDSLLPLAAGAYSNQPQKCLSNIFGDGQLRRLVSVRCDFFITNTCAGYTATIPSKKAIVVAFRGSNRFLQLLEQGRKTIFEQQMSWIAGGRVSRYFGDAFLKLWNQGIKSDFNGLLNRYPDYEIWLTGHSLGGALASLAASYIISTGLVTQDKIKLVTFGEPRIGNADFAAAHDAQMDYTFRVVHDRDLVPTIPPRALLGYTHSKTEIYYGAKMDPTNFIVCQGNEDNNCSNSNGLNVSILQHIDYFDKAVLFYGVAGCK